jgi:myo-inositol-1(or 4)-monophosphatase
MDYWCISLAYVRENTTELGIIYAPDRMSFSLPAVAQGHFLTIGV